MTFGDPGIRKHMQRVIVNYKPESVIDADLTVCTLSDQLRLSKITITSLCLFDMFKELFPDPS